jgi:hypothetical protein
VQKFYFLAGFSGANERAELHFGWLLLNVRKFERAVGFFGDFLLRRLSGEVLFCGICRAAKVCGGFESIIFSGPAKSQLGLESLVAQHICVDLCGHTTYNERSENFLACALKHTCRLINRL